MDQNIPKKNLSLDLALFFVEELITSFHLEDALINSNPEMKSNLEAVGTLNENLPERTSIKFLFNNGVPFKPTSTLRQILEDLINNKLNFQNLSSVLEKELGIQKKDADIMVEKIQTNPKIIQEKNSEAADYSGIVNDFGKEFSTSFDETKSTTTKTLPKGINQDLL